MSSKWTKINKTPRKQLIPAQNYIHKNTSSWQEKSQCPLHNWYLSVTPVTAWVENLSSEGNLFTTKAKGTVAVRELFSEYVWRVLSKIFIERWQTADIYFKQEIWCCSFENAITILNLPGMDKRHFCISWQANISNRGRTTTMFCPTKSRTLWKIESCYRNGWCGTFLFFPSAVLKWLPSR